MIHATEYAVGPETPQRNFMVTNTRHARSLSAAALALALGIAGCKGDSTGGGTGPTPTVPPTPPIVTGAPTAAFTAAASVNAFDPVTFDAATSTSTDGSALQYVWDFGGGERGGGKMITRSFASGGSRSVTLTVFDGANRSASTSRSVSIVAPPAPVTTRNAEGVVKALDGTAISGVTIAQVGGSATGITDSIGKTRLMLGTGSPMLLKFSKAGYADQLLALTFPATAGADAAFDVAMRTRDAALTLPDAAAGGSLTGRDGALLSLPANALVNAAGASVTGAVQIAITPVDVTQNAAGGFPGSFTGLTQAGTSTPIVSFGTTEYVLTSGGQSVQVAPGKRATIELPMYASKRLTGTLLVVGDTIPLWSLSESTGAWVQEGTGTVVASPDSPSGLALRATVSHFSWWNVDLGFDPYGPQPKCVNAADIGIPGSNNAFASATICNMLAQIDSSSGGPSPKVVSGAARVTTAALEPRIAGYSVYRSIPIEGGVTVPVPANLNVLFKATALNGTWIGSTVVNGQVGVRAEALIRMRPLNTTGAGASEAITLPFDAMRALPVTPPTSQFTFAGVAAKYARIQLSPGNASVITGRVRLLQGATVLATVTIASSTALLTTLLPTDAPYTIEVAGDAAAAFRLQVSLLGGAVAETITLPVSITRTIAAYGTFNGTFTVTAPTTIYLARSSQNNLIDVRLLGPTGTVLIDAISLPDASRGVSLTLPAAGSYVVEIRPRTIGNPANVTLSVEQSLWAQIAPPIDYGGTTGSQFQLIDAQSDRNGKVVVAYTESVGNANRLKLQRWTGTAWEAAAPDLLISQPCNNNGNASSFAFDNANNPVVLYGNRNPPSDSTYVAARRYSGGTWQAIGPNDGRLPVKTQFGSACASVPALAIGSDNAPIAAYQADNNIVVQRFDGALWKGLAQADTNADIFAVQNGSYDLKVDATGRVWFVTGSPIFSGVPALVRRFNPTTTAWETIGGPLQQTNTQGLNTPRLRFDAAGLPVIAWLAAVGSGGVASPGLAVYRYNGTAWSTTGGFQVANNLVATGTNDLGFAIVNGDAIVSWTSAEVNVGNGYGVMVQRNAASGWTPIGGRDGQVPQFTRGAINDGQSSSSRLITIGGELYLVLIANQPVGQTNPYRIVLLRRVAN